MCRDAARSGRRGSRRGARGRRRRTRDRRAAGRRRGAPSSDRRARTRWRRSEATELALDPGEHRPGEAQIASDERRRAGRHLERQPPVVADVAERPGALGEVDPSEPRPRVARRHTHVLDVHPPHELAESANLRRAVEAAPERVREVEVAPEGGRADALGEQPDRARRKEPFEAERDPRLAASGHSAVNAAAQRSNASCPTSSPRMKKGTSTTSAPRSAETPIAWRTSSAAASATPGSASAIPPWLCSPRTRAWISSGWLTRAARTLPAADDCRSRRPTRELDATEPESLRDLEDVTAVGDGGIHQRGFHCRLGCEAITASMRPRRPRGRPRLPSSATARRRRSPAGR